MKLKFGAIALLVCSFFAEISCARHATVVDESGTRQTSIPTDSAVRFLLVNDVYVADPIRDGTGGLSRVAALRDSIERATRSRVIYVLAGDVLSPSFARQVVRRCTDG